MNVTCGSCQAKYSVADEKVQRRKVKIVCKRCQSALVVDGTQTPATVTTVKAGANVAAPPAGGTPAPPPRPSAAPTAPSAQKRTMMGGLSVQPPTGPAAPGAAAPAADADATVVAREGELQRHFAAQERGNDDATVAIKTAAAEELLRQAAEGAPRGEIARAPDDDTAATRIATRPAGTPAPARASEPPGPAAPTPTPPHGRATPRPPARPRHVPEDERALLGLAPRVEVPDAPPDSLVNISAGGLFTPPAMAAPDFSAPTPPSVRPAREAGAGSGRGKLVLAAAALAAVAVAVFVARPAALVGEPSSSSATARAEPTSARASEGPTATAREPASAATSAAPGPAASAPPTASAGTAAAPAASSLRAEPVARAEERPGAAPAATTTAAPTATSTTGTPEPPKPAAAPSDLPPFDQGAARAALGAAAGSAGSCKQADGPTGSGKVSVTFAPSGRATNAVVSGALAGTPVGGCVARIFRGARVPPFSGDPVTVGKSFSVE